MERLTGAVLKREQERTLAAPRMRYGLLARVLFCGMDLLYGQTRTLSKFKVLELIARVPYQAWEQVAYVAMTHTSHDPGFARRIFERVRQSRQQQDNEQWHLLVLQELIARSGMREGWMTYWLVPQIVAFVYYQIAWLLYVLRPVWAYRLNAEFEDHAEHEYMEFVREHPELEHEPFDSFLAADYGSFDSRADLFRQIGYDERVHKEESLAWASQPRFT
ncbi:MAG TPA: alternative oxidase [Methylomirabilota bacterium]|nr:alternative oxidase [Methylomirabilota bacterium]